MLEELINLEERFQPYLQNDDYTFIGPANPDLLGGFIQAANQLAPVVAFSRSIHHALSHVESVRAALGVLPPNSDLRIYVVTRSELAFIHSEIEVYCDQNNIEFP